MTHYAGTVEMAQLLSRLGSDTVLRCLSDLAGNGPDLVPMPDDPKVLFGSVFTAGIGSERAACPIPLR